MRHAQVTLVEFFPHRSGVAPTRIVLSLENVHPGTSAQSSDEPSILSSVKGSVKECALNFISVSGESTPKWVLEVLEATASGRSLSRIALQTPSWASIVFSKPSLRSDSPSSTQCLSKLFVAVSPYVEPSRFVNSNRWRKVATPMNIEKAEGFRSVDTKAPSIRNAKKLRYITSSSTSVATQHWGLHPINVLPRTPVANLVTNGLGPRSWGHLCLSPYSFYCSLSRCGDLGTPFLSQNDRVGSMNVKRGYWS